MYLFFERLQTSIISKTLNITVESCDTSASTKSYTFETEITQIDELLANIKEENWFPLSVVYNRDWSSIEFICEIKIDLISITNEENLMSSFKKVR